MSFRSLTSSICTRTARALWESSLPWSQPARSLTCRVHVEALEDRRMLSFSPATNYSVSALPTAMVSGDFNADGRLDLATANLGSNDVSILLGNADGSFQAPQAMATGVRPASIATGDFNADGKLDLATANDGDVSVLLGNGNGSFQAPASIAIGSEPAAVAVGDFNGDGKLDLGVTSNVYYPGSWGYYGQYPGYYVGRANVLLGNGGGAFSAPSTTFLNYGTHKSAAAADLNNDGKLDFAATSFEYGSVAVALGNGAGSLGTASYFGTAYYAQSLAVGDVDGDGELDLITANLFTDNVGVLLGVGDGTFGAAQFHAAGDGPYSVAISDFNADGEMDLITANASDGSASVLLGDGSGAFQPPLTLATAAGSAGIAVGDFNGDGRVDAATANADSSTLSVLLNDANWPAADAPTISIGNAADVVEGNAGTTSATFTVALSSAFNLPVTVRYNTADGSATLADGDYTATSGTLTFAPGETSKTLTVLIQGDRRPELLSESFSVRLLEPTNGFVGNATGTAIIVDDEVYVNIGGYEAAEGNSGTTAFAFNVTLSAPYDAPVTVDYYTSELTIDEQYYFGPAASAGVDFQNKSGTLTFAAGQTSQTIVVEVIGDRLGEWNFEYFSVYLTNPVGVQLSSLQAYGTIVDDEPVVHFVDNYGTAMEGNSGTTVMEFEIGLSSVYDAPVTVVFTTFDNSAQAGSDYVAVTTTVTFAAGQTRLAVPVTIKGDLLNEGDELFYVQLSEATGGTILNPTSFGYITDDDLRPAISINDVTQREGSSGTTRFVFTVSLSSPAETPVTIDYATANGTARKNDNDYAAKNGRLKFAVGETTKTITISVKGDRKKEAHESFFVNLTNARGALIDDAQGVGTIVDDDHVASQLHWLSYAWNSLNRAIDDFADFRLNGRRR